MPVAMMVIVVVVVGGRGIDPMGMTSPTDLWAASRRSPLPPPPPPPSHDKIKKR